MDAKGKIIFEYKKTKYTVSQPGNPIILSNGYVISGDGWANEIFPPNPGNITTLFKIDCVGKSLIEIAKTLGWTLAVEVVVNKIITCPNGCSRPTEPYCKKCGAKVEVDYDVKPTNKLDKI